MTRTRVLAGVLLTAGFGVTHALDPWQHESVTDVPLYLGYADLFFDGVLPYRDVGFEYPPLAAPLIALPGLVSLELYTYRLAFTALTLALAAGLMLATARAAVLSGGSEWRALLAVAAAPLVAGAMIRTHFDLAPVLCLVAGLAGIAGGRLRTGFVLLGVGGALKLFPLAGAVVAATWLAGRGRGREALQGLGLAGAVMALAVAAAIALSPDGAWNAVEYHLERPVQVESLPATVLNTLDAAGARPPDPVHSHRSDGLEHPAAGALVVAFTVLLLAALAALALAVRRLEGGRGLILAGLGSAAAFASLGKVLSPQFMLWLVPLAALAWAWRMHALAAITTAAVALTLAWFPSRYFDVVYRHTAELGLVALRNLLLVAVLALVARELRRLLRESPAAARSTPPDRPGALRSAPR